MRAPARRGAARSSRKGLRAALIVLSASALFVVRGGGSRTAASAPAPVNLSRSVGPSEDPAVALRGANGIVVWTEGERIWHAVRTAGGWQAAAPVPGASGSTPAVAAAPDGSYHVVWSALSLVDDNFEIFESTLAQGAWSLPENLSGTATDSLGPAIAARADGGLLVVWTEMAADGPQIVAASRPAGASWSSGPVPDADGQDPVVAAAGADWHLAWSEALEPGQPSEIVYARRAPTGWSLPEAVSSSAAVTSSDAALAVDAAGAPAIAWLEGDSAIAFSRRLPDGWTAPRLLAQAAAGALGGPALAAQDGRTAAAWARQAAVEVLGDVAGAPDAAATAMTFARRARGAALAPDGAGFLVVAEGREDSDAGDIYAMAAGALAVPTATETAEPTAAAATLSPTPSSTREATPASTPTGAAPSPTGTAPGSPTRPASTASATNVRPAASPTAGSGGRIFLPYGVRTMRSGR